MIDQKVPEAASLARWIKGTLPSGNTSKLDLAAAIVRLKSTECDKALKYLLGELNMPTEKFPPMPRALGQTSGNESRFPYWKMYVIDALGQTGNSKTIEPLIKVITTFVKRKGAAGYMEIAGGPSDDELASYAVDALSQLAADGVVMPGAASFLSLKALKRMEKESTRTEFWVRTARGILRFQKTPVKATLQAIKGVMGKRWVVQELTIRELKEIPSHLRPREEFIAETRFDDQSDIDGKVSAGKPPQALVE